MIVYWTARARMDREVIYDFIERDNPSAAIRLDETIATCARSLAAYPERGRLGRVDGTRELILAGTSYLLIYRIEDSRVRILRVLHAAQLWPQ